MELWASPSPVLELLTYPGGILVPPPRIAGPPQRHCHWLTRFPSLAPGAWSGRDDPSPSESGMSNSSCPQGWQGAHGAGARWHRLSAPCSLLATWTRCGASLPRCVWPEKERRWVAFLGRPSLSALPWAPGSGRVQTSWGFGRWSARWEGLGQLFLISTLTRCLPCFSHNIMNSCQRLLCCGAQCPDWPLCQSEFLR